MKKIKINKFLWNFNFYRMFLKKINNKTFDKTLNNDEWILIDLNKITNDYIKNKLSKDIINNLKNNNRYWLFFNNDEFLKWFNSNKNINKKYLLINNFYHCKYQYRLIRYNGYKSYLIKNKF